MQRKVIAAAVTLIQILSVGADLPRVTESLGVSFLYVSNEFASSWTKSLYSQMAT